MLKRDEEFIVAWRGSRVPSCARSKVKRACVLLHKAVCYVRAAHEAWKFCVTVLSSSTDFIFSTVSYYRQFCWSSRKQQSAFVNRMQYRSRVVESITLVWKKKKRSVFVCYKTNTHGLSGWDLRTICSAFCISSALVSLFVLLNLTLVSFSCSIVMSLFCDEGTSITRALHCTDTYTLAHGLLTQAILTTNSMSRHTIPVHTERKEKLLRHANQNRDWSLTFHYRLRQIRFRFTDRSIDPATLSDRVSPA